MLYYGYKLAIFLAIHLPLAVSYKLASLIANLIYLFNHRLRVTIQSHISHLVQSTQLPLDADRLTKETLVNFYKYLVDFFRVSRLTADYVSQHIPIHGKEYLDTAIAEGKKIVILTGHIGNWELGAVALSKLGYRFTSLALDHPDPRVNRLFQKRRKSAGIQVYPLNITGIRECYKALESGRIVALLGDLEFGTGGIDMDWFGEKVKVPKGPAMLARRTGAIVIPAVMVREKDDQLAIYIAPPMIPQKTDNPEQDIINDAKRYLEVFSQFIIKYPNQWYRFR
ncbi:MAG: lysophospholipid acyltransferase family protein [bacterium]